MNTPDFKKSYKRQTSDLLSNYDQSTAMSLAVGGDFKAVGLLEYHLLSQSGLDGEHTFIDFGCDSRRLASQLK